MKSNNDKKTDYREQRKQEDQERETEQGEKEKASWPSDEDDEE